MSRLPALGPRGEGWVAVQVPLFVLVGLAGLLGPAWDGPARLATSAGGAALLVAGATLAARGVLDLRSALTPLPRPRDDAELVDRGVYGLVRHPIYGGIVLAAAGYGLLAAAPAALVGAAALLLFFDLKSRVEEAWLAAQYAGYDAYRARTRKLLPYLY